MKKIKIVFYFLLSAVFICGCSSNDEPVIEYKYTITYGGFTGGWYKTNDYKIIKGYYVFICDKDTFKLKETAVEQVRTNHNYR